MRVKINSDAYKTILTADWTSVSADDAALAWIVNRALSAAGQPPLFDIDDADTDDTALIVLAPAPDDYRGSMDAIHILFPDVDLKVVDDFDQGDVCAVYRKDGKLLGHLTTYYGNNGRGGLAAQDFDPAPGVVVKFN
jgi:hypothetical protein